LSREAVAKAPTSAGELDYLGHLLKNQFRMQRRISKSVPPIILQKQYTFDMVSKGEVNWRSVYTKHKFFVAGHKILSHNTNRKGSGYFTNSATGHEKFVFSQRHALCMYICTHLLCMN
jgi:hypothetical protein